MTKKHLGYAAALAILTWGCSSNDAGNQPGPAGEAGSGGAPVAVGGNTSAGATTTVPGGSASGGNAGSPSSTGGGGAGPGGGGNGTAGMGGMIGPITPVGETPEAKWVNITNNLAGMASECGNLGRVSSHPYSDLLIVGVAQKGLFGSTDGGASWNPLGGASAKITNRISWLAYDPTAPMTFYESGIYNGGGVY